MRDGRKILFYGILILICYAAIEVFAFAAHFFVKGHALSRGDYQAERLKLIFAPPVQPNPGKSPAVLHPYLGYVEAPSQGSISEFGFFGDTREAPLSPPKTEHNIIAGVFGGSFANEMTLQSKDTLREKIQQIPRFRNKEIIIHTLALRGYKQPQQASALMYFLLLGGYFDMVINLDGFNEVAMSPVTNLPNRVNPFFPKNWFWKVYALKDLGIFMQLDKMSHIKKRQQLWAEIFANSPLRHSVSANILWKAYHQRLERSFIRQERRLNEYQVEKKVELDYLVTGPPFRYRDSAELYEKLAFVWKNASFQMHKLCQANDIAYFHFLQPNQYIEHSKIIGPEEAEIALTDGHPYRKGAEMGYPFLVRNGKELRQQGVNYYDLTMLFEETSEPMYRDDCCHLNTRGYDSVASEIGDILQGYYQ